jgi:hypothetical protein
MNIFKKKIIVFLVPLFFINTYTVFADVTPSTGNQQNVTRAITNVEGKTLQQLVVDTITLITSYALQILLALTILVFLYGLMKFMFKGRESNTARAEGRQVMLWGIIGIFVITSIWGLVAIASSLIGHTSVVVPQFK